MKELPIDDIALLRGFNSRDVKSINKLHSRYYHQLFHFARNFLKEDKDRAHDAVVDAFVALLNVQGEFENLGLIKNWLFTRVRWICLDILKRKPGLNLITPPDEFEVTDEDPTVEEKRIKAEVIDAVFKEIEKLPGRHKTILKFYFLEGKKTREIATILHMPVKTVQNIRTQLLKIIKNELIRKSLMVLVLGFLIHLLRSFFIK